MKKYYIAIAIGLFGGLIVILADYIFEHEISKRIALKDSNIPTKDLIHSMEAKIMFQNEFGGLLFMRKFHLGKAENLKEAVDISEEFTNQVSSLIYDLNPKAFGRVSVDIQWHDEIYAHSIGVDRLIPEPEKESKK